jgi:hypothetical protein
MKIIDLIKPIPKKEKKYIFTASQMKMILDQLCEDLIKNRKIFK